MKTKLAIAFFCASSLAAFAADESASRLVSIAESTSNKDSHSEVTDSVYWKFPGAVGLNANQAYFNEYCSDGMGSSATVDAFIRLNADYMKGKVMWKNAFSAQYGFMYSDQFTGDDEVRKNMDNFALASKVGYKAADKLYYSLMGDLESQFTKGYNYASDVNNLDSAYLVSNFFAPAYAKLSLGVDYTPNKYLTVFASPLSARFTFCTDTLLSPNFGMERKDNGEYKKSRTELGAYAKAVSDFDVTSNVHFYSLLEGFYAYNKAVQRTNVTKDAIGNCLYFDELSDFAGDINDETIHGWFVRWRLELALKVTKNINVAFRTQLKYDVSETKQNPHVDKDAVGLTSKWDLGYPVAKTQFWESTSLGIAYQF
ncbi:MAG: DUF3078 domain-containing protein [Paludibacteraceae bacterium]|nr:DUF3078 domain-containing protein [Paludibacteraceae bacterium]